MYLAIDYGKKNIGLALSDETKKFAGALPVLKVKTQEEAIEGIKHMIGSYPQIETLVIGLPLATNLKPTQMSNEIKDFAEKLTKNVNKEIKIKFTNELYSSKQAEKGKSKKFKKEKSHSEAARIFLQEYLDHVNSKK